jgi:hypothetical protein
MFIVALVACASTSKQEVMGESVDDPAPQKIKSEWIKHDLWMAAQRLESPQESESS